MTIDLKSYSLKELKDLQSQVAKAISTFEDRKKKEALAKLEEKAREMGFSLAELTGACQDPQAQPGRSEIRQSRRCHRHLVRPWPQTALVCRRPGQGQKARIDGDLGLNTRPTAPRVVL